MKHCEVHILIEAANSTKLSLGTIVKLDSWNWDDLSKIPWIHPIAWINKAGSAASPQQPAHLEVNQEAYWKQSGHAYLTKKSP
jgi:hypothetical protein